MNQRSDVAVDPALIDALNESTVASPEDTLMEAEAFAEDEGYDRDYAFDRFNTIN